MIRPLCLAVLVANAVACIEWPGPPTPAITADTLEDVYEGPVTLLTVAPVDLFNQVTYENVEVCSLSYPQSVGCATTSGSTAVARLQVPQTEQILVMGDPDPNADPVVDSEAFYPTLLPLEVDLDSFKTLAVLVLRGDFLTLLANAVEGTEVAFNQAHIGISVTDDGGAGTPSVSGASFTTDCPSDGVFYVHKDPLAIARQLAETDATLGTAAVLNIDPSVETCRVVIDHPDRPDCRVFSPGWQDPSNPNASIVPVRAGHLSAVRFGCPAPP